MLASTIFQTIHVFEPDGHSSSMEVVRIESDLVKVSLHSPSFTRTKHGHVPLLGFIWSGPKYISNEASRDQALYFWYLHRDCKGRGTVIP